MDTGELARLILFPAIAAMCLLAMRSRPAWQLWAGMVLAVFSVELAGHLMAPESEASSLLARLSANVGYIPVVAFLRHTEFSRDHPIFAFIGAVGLFWVGFFVFLIVGVNTGFLVP